jgi:AraC-like DNA-binding protein
LWAPALVYAGLLIVRGALGLDTRVPFQWLLPVVLTFTALCVWYAASAGTASRGLVSARHVAAFAVILNVAQVIRMLFGDWPLVPAIVPLAATAGFASIVALVVWRSVRGPMEAPAVAPRYERSSLDAADAAVLWSRIDEALGAGGLSADAGLTLARLAAAVESTPHQVSEALNRFAGTSFHELIARRRVEAIKAMLREPATDRFTIEGLGQSAGFGSRSAMYAAFRRLEGASPAEYRARVRRVD